MNRFVASHEELQLEALDSVEWGAIEIVADWLFMFRKATTLMSSTKTSTISYVFRIFVSLQDMLRAKIACFPPDTPQVLRSGLIKAHAKLAEYFQKFDDSPYYLWASCKCARETLCCLFY
jgi:hypothetical protein